VRRSFDPLTVAAFRNFGSVIEAPAHGGTAINDGSAVRYDDRAELVLDGAGGRPLVSLFVVQPAVLPLVCTQLERHPLSSQLFMPLVPRRFAVVVALGDTAPDPSTLRGFITNGRQGVNYAPGVWHHPVLALDCATEFFVIGRRAHAASEDFDLVPFPGDIVLELS
jgi:ureidoglycolate lyase